MAITIYEYSNTADGLPVQPASIRRADEAFEEAHGFDDRTEYVAVIADADAYLRISLDGAAAAWQVFGELFPDGAAPARTTTTTDFVDAACLVQLDAVAVAH